MRGKSALGTAPATSPSHLSNGRGTPCRSRAPSPVFLICCLFWCRLLDMWFVYVLGHVFLLSLVNYIDEYLTTNNKVPQTSNIHTRIGGLLLISTLLGVLGASIIWVIFQDVQIPQLPFTLAILSAIPMVIMFASYFYLLTLYPTYQVVPLFLISSIWLLVIELMFGGSLTAGGLAGIITLTIGAYLLDAGSFKWQIPTKLLLIAVPVTSAWAIALFMVRTASQVSPPALISFWQFVGSVIIGMLLFLFVKKYRDGLLFRIRQQGKNFLGFSFLNESLAQGSYVFGNFAVAAAPVATYVTAMSGVQSVFLLLLFLFFPLHKERAQVTKLQMASVVLIAIGVFLIEGLN